MMKVCSRGSAWIVARLGGRSGRTSRGYRPPGTKTMHHGLLRLGPDPGRLVPGEPFRGCTTPVAADRGSKAYTDAVNNLDADMAQYIHDNTDDEFSHRDFLNAYLASKGADQVNLDQFRTLPSSKATGANQIGRLTNLMQLTVDTSCIPVPQQDQKSRSQSRLQISSEFVRKLSIEIAQLS